MREAVIPNHYRIFMVMVIVMGVAALFLLPAGERKLKLPYFFMGAGFFLIETNNVIALSLLYGSTWVVNVLVFTGILLLILLGNLTCMLMERPRFPLVFALLFVNLAAAYVISPADFLKIDSHLPAGTFGRARFFGSNLFCQCGVRPLDQAGAEPLSSLWFKSAWRRYRRIARILFSGYGDQVSVGLYLWVLCSGFRVCDDKQSESVAA